ncbi:L-threonylcarbamoyladenylate synthase [Robertkochia sediminum]|uniref:L-threonylcarbamoyladenylate synthase n=1 Tax=Robertkochia sediminum TaxID=2785326 RepID=UPI001932238C|nr:L-threonylcarbamoyladenylate synthase [Robertkochia sediminum]MBL7472655.1 threonylcarbamoyl-AMP synthase [Robertkochia sediminum]
MHEEIAKCLEVLNQGGLILYPTDTVWAIGCDARNPEAVQKVYDLKKSSEKSGLVCLVPNTRMLERYVYEVPDPAYDIIEVSSRPTTIIYDQPMNVAPNLPGKDNTLAIRVASDEFCQRLTARLKRPLVSATANLSGSPIPRSFAEINSEILKGVDYIVNLHREKKSGPPSTIIKLGNSGLVRIIRK